MPDVGPSDLSVLLFFIFCSLIVSLILYFATKKNKLVFVFSMSVLSNISVSLFKDTLFFWKFDILWLKRFALDYWPWINVALFVILVGLLVRNKIKKNK